MQEKVTAESDEFQSTGCPKVSIKSVINLLTKEQAKGWASCIKFDMLPEQRRCYSHGLWEQMQHSTQSWVGK